MPASRRTLSRQEADPGTAGSSACASCSVMRRQLKMGYRSSRSAAPPPGGSLRGGVADTAQHRDQRAVDRWLSPVYSRCGSCGGRLLGHRGRIARLPSLRHHSLGACSALTRPQAGLSVSFFVTHFCRIVFVSFPSPLAGIVRLVPRHSPFGQTVPPHSTSRSFRSLDSQGTFYALGGSCAILRVPAAARSRWRVCDGGPRRRIAFGASRTVDQRVRTPAEPHAFVKIRPRRWRRPGQPLAVHEPTGAGGAYRDSRVGPARLMPQPMS